MKKVTKKSVVLLVVFSVIAFTVFGCAPSSQTKTNISMNGSTTVFPIAQKVAEVYMDRNPSVNITIEGTGSSNGIAALIDGITDIATASREVKSSEFEKEMKRV